MVRIVSILLCFATPYTKAVPLIGLYLQTTVNKSIKLAHVAFLEEFWNVIPIILIGVLS